MTRWRSHGELIVVIMALALWASCSKPPVDYPRTGAGTAGPVATAPTPSVSREPVSPPVAQDSGTTGAATSPGADASAPAGPLVGAQRPSPGDYSAADALKDVYFDYDRHALTPEAARTLTANAAWLKSHPGTAVLVEGHCDARGTGEYNLALGQRRAQSVRDFLLAQGIQASRIATISYGKERAACSESTEECWARNRRAHFLVKPA